MCVIRRVSQIDFWPASRARRDRDAPSVFFRAVAAPYLSRRRGIRIGDVQESRPHATLPSDEPYLATSSIVDRFVGVIRSAAPCVLLASHRFGVTKSALTACASQGALVAATVASFLRSLRPQE